MNRKPPIITTQNNTKARSAIDAKARAAIASHLADKAPPDPRLVAAALGASPIRDHVLAIVLEYEALAGKIRDTRARGSKIWNSGLSRVEIQAMRRAVGTLEAAAGR